MRTIRQVFLTACVLAVLGGAKVQSTESPGLLAQLKGKLVSLNGNVTVPANDAAFGEPKYIALYFGAGWCGPCHKFTPDLISFYNEMRSKHPEFQVLFMSRDTSPNEMQQYMADMHMPWPALRFDAIRWSTQLNSYCGPGIPCLVLLDASGHVLSDSYQGKNYLGPHKVLNDLRHILEQGSAASAGAPASASPAAAHTGTPDSPSNTKWDEVFKKKSP